MRIDETSEDVNGNYEVDPALETQDLQGDGGITFDELTDVQKAAWRAKSKKSSKGEKPPKFTQWDLVEIVTRAINKNYLPDPWKEFGREYRIMEDDRGQKTIFLIQSGQVLKSVDKECLATDINRYVRSHSHVKIFPSEMVIKETIANWTRNSEPLAFDIPGPRCVDVVRQKSTPGYTLQRLPWDLCEGPTPLFDDMMSRTSNTQALMDFIGSLFISKSDRQTFVWLYGEGGDGKSTLLRMIENAFGPSYMNDDPDHMDSNFWTSGILGKRIVAFPDLNDTKLLRKGIFKRLTGGDTLRTEFKGKTPFNSKSKTMVFCSSNDRPIVTSQASDIRRIIYCEMSPPKNWVLGFEKTLWEDEARHFFYKCVRGYLTRYPALGAIQPETKAVLDLADSQQSFNQMLFEKHFEVIEYSEKEEKRAVPCSRVEVILKDIEKLQTRDINEFRKFLEKHLRFKREAVRFGPAQKVIKCWVGFKELNDAQKSVSLKADDL